MRDKLFTRFVRAILGVWFIAAVGGPVSELSCPEHDAHAAMEQNAVEHAHHGSLASTHSETTDDDPDDTSCCTCPGKCSIAMYLPVPVASVQFAPINISGQSERTFAPVHSFRTAARWILPPSHGPPSFASV